MDRPFAARCQVLDREIQKRMAKRFHNKLCSVTRQAFLPYREVKTFYCFGLSRLATVSPGSSRQQGGVRTSFGVEYLTITVTIAFVQKGQVVGLAGYGN
jgi:hypothetical protein